jgi:hypothetical protein
MAFPRRKSPLGTHRLLNHAKCTLVMPGANALTRELTATLLKSHGLLGELDRGIVPISQGKPIRAATRQRAAALRREVEQLHAQAVLLCIEAEGLCKPQRRSPRLKAVSDHGLHG